MPRPAHHLALLLAFASGGASACTAMVGDACETQQDCGQELYCEQSLTDGYCTLRDCDVDGCPDEGVCVTFYQVYPDDADGTEGAVAPSSYLSYCMLACDSESDCRAGYRCVKDYGAHPFCNDNDGEIPET